MKRKIIITAAVFGALAVIAGAFGAHGLEGKLTPKSFEVWHTAVQYQFYHVFALLFLSTLTRYKTGLVKNCYNLFTLGVILFSGSLYLLAFSQMFNWQVMNFIGPVTPLGGLLLIGGWVTLGIAALTNKFV
ncbi:DUF423 domain-containing protein [Mucilaginibacter sp.]|uniref:DUF423 domain-containing protein n=1 Tax=Mucilaginibacter sp. TaxID=1882438 RepID=UPI003D153520